MMELYHSTSEQCSRMVTESYSTSFYSAIRMLHRDLRSPICNIYGFVRLADEIVDTFHAYEKKELLARFRNDTFEAIQGGISINPILHSFQRTVRDYNISLEQIDAFFKSMEMDLEKTCYNSTEYREYIYGSAEVVGLMCLSVFCEGNVETYEKLKKQARSLGAAFQKVNFLRDFKADYEHLTRVYFPTCDFGNFTMEDKRIIEEDICNDFKKGYEGIQQLPVKARFAVYVAYKYYFSLFRKIRKMKPSKVLEKRIRIPNYYKALIFFRAGIKNQLRLI